MKIKVLIFIMLIGTIVSSCGNQQDAGAKKKVADATAPTLSEKDKDGLIIFNYSMADTNLATLPKSVRIEKTEDKINYIFTDHVLSCGTYMNGVVTETKENNLIRQIGSFVVTKNPYDIADLKIDITFDPNDVYTTRNGSFTVDGKLVKLKGYQLSY